MQNSLIFAYFAFRIAQFKHKNQFPGTPRDSAKLNRAINMMEKVRLDKWLWAVRIYKTRTLATEACKKGRIFVNTLPAKASREIVEGDTVTVRKMPVIYSFIVRKTVEKRLSARLVEEYLKDITSLEELDKLKLNASIFVKRDRGTGRPTKKERRQLDELNEEV